MKGASFEDGLLKIDLVREVPEAMKPRRIAINAQPNLPTIEHKKKPPERTEPLSHRPRHDTPRTAQQNIKSKTNDGEGGKLPSLATPTKWVRIWQPISPIHSTHCSIYRGLLDSRIASDWLQDQTAARRGRSRQSMCSNKARTSWPLLNCRVWTRTTCKSKRKKTPLKSRERKAPNSLKVSASTGENGCSGNLTARCRFLSKLIRTASRQSIEMEYSRCSYPGLSAISRER